MQFSYGVDMFHHCAWHISNEDEYKWIISLVKVKNFLPLLFFNGFALKHTIARAKLSMQNKNGPTT